MTNLARSRRPSRADRSEPASDQSRLTPRCAEPLIRHLGFLAHGDLPDRPGPAYLIVAIRPTPTRSHYDPEQVQYWAAWEGRGSRRRLSWDTRVPLESSFSWGMIRIVDRFDVTNEYLTFGGRLAVDRVGEVLISVFTSSAPILRRGGHSQVWDPGADTLGAFYSRFLLAVDYVRGFEAEAAAADPDALYAMFLAEVMGRYRSRAALRAEHVDVAAMFGAEERRLRRGSPTAWAAGERLLEMAMTLEGRG